MRAKSAGEVLEFRVHFSEYRVLVTPHNEIPDPGHHQLVFTRSYLARENSRDPFEREKNLVYLICIVWALEIDVCPSAAAPIVPNVAVTSRAKGFSERNPSTGTRFLEIPTARFEVRSVVRSEQQCHIRGRTHGLPKEIVHPLQVLFRFRRFRRPHVHSILRGVDLKATNIRAVLEDIDGCLRQPLVDLPAIDRRCGAEPLNPLRRWVLRREHELSAANKQTDRLFFAG